MAKPTIGGVPQPLGHVVHVERLEDHGVRIWLDGVPVKSLRSWSLVEDHRPPSVMTLTINTDAIVWGAPPAPAAEPAPAVDDGLEHFVEMGPSGRRTPSGKYACEACGEVWVCSTVERRGQYPPRALVPELDKVSDAPLGLEYDEGRTAEA